MRPQCSLNWRLVVTYVTEGPYLTQSNLERATIVVNIRGYGNPDGIPRVGDVLLVQQLGTLRTDNLNIEVPRSSALRTR